ncbi:MAG: hypothetical protein R3176_03250 [Woeseiaceae bacterium]|nr:hypothetical protein [Woeseiaceae bacterium]
MNTRIYTIIAVVLLAVTLSAPASAGDARLEFGFDAAAGIEQDSNVGIAEIDTNTGEADSATRLEVGIDARLAATDRLSLRLGYDYTDLAYSEFSEFDLGLGHALAEVGLDLPIVDAAVTAERFDGRLDDEAYLVVTQVTPSLSKLVGRRVYLRAAYTAAEKEFDVLSSRNADNEALRGDVYLLLRGMDRYLALGLQSAEEDAVSAEYDYASTLVSLAYGHKVAIAGKPLKLKAQLSRLVRDYDNVTESIGEVRRDERTRSSLTATLEMSKSFMLEGKVERMASSSNLPAADLEKTVYGIALKVSF